MMILITEMREMAAMVKVFSLKPNAFMSSNFAARSTKLKHLLEVMLRVR